MKKKHVLLSYSEPSSVLSLLPNASTLTTELQQTSMNTSLCQRKFLRKIAFPNDPVIPLLKIYPNSKCKSTHLKKTGTPMFVEVLSAITRVWKQCKHPRIDQWLEKPWYVYIHTILSSHKTRYIHGLLQLDGTGASSLLSKSEE